MIDSELSSLFTFIREREAARCGNSTDPIIHSYHFTNVYREYDTGTRFIRAYVAQHPHQNIFDAVWTYAIYRWINYSMTFERRGFPATNEASLTNWYETLLTDRARKVRICSIRHWTSLPLTYAGGKRLLHMRTSLQDELAMTKDGMTFASVLHKCHGIGPFFSVQITADYLRDPITHLSAHERVPLAVGSRAGVHLMRTGEFSDNSERTGKIRHVRGITQDESIALELIRTDSRLPSDMTYVDIEHTLCEWYKWRAFQSGHPVKMRKRRL